MFLGPISLIYSAIKQKNTNKNISQAKKYEEEAVEKLSKASNEYSLAAEKSNEATNKLTSKINNIITSFNTFSAIFEKIKNKPEFTKYSLKLKYFETISMLKATYPTYFKERVGSYLATAVFGSIGAAVYNKRSERLLKEKIQQAKEIDEEVTKLRHASLLLDKLQNLTKEYTKVLDDVYQLYIYHLEQLNTLVNINHKYNYLTYNEDEKKLLENTILLVGLLHQMGKIQLTVDDGDEPKLNSQVINNQITQAKNISTLIFIDTIKKIIKSKDKDLFEF